MYYKERTSIKTLIIKELSPNNVGDSGSSIIGHYDRVSLRHIFVATPNFLSTIVMY